MTVHVCTITTAEDVSVSRGGGSKKFDQKTQHNCLRDVARNRDQSEYMRWTSTYVYMMRNIACAWMGSDNNDAIVGVD